MAGLGKGALLAAEISKEGGGKASPAHSNLFVGNIAATVTEDELRAAFGPFGEIESVFLTSKAGRPSGFVKMKEVDGAARAVEALNDSQGWVVKFANYDVGKAPKYNQKGGKGFQAFWPPWAAPFGFPGPWGPKGGWGKGFGPKGYPGANFGGWTYVKGGTGFGKGGVPELREDGPERPEPPQSDNLYVKHLPLGVTEENLRETFSTCGEVAEVRVLRPDFALECAALVRFVTVGDAEKARTTLDSTVVKGSTPSLYANAQNKRGASKQDHVYLKNVPTNASEDKLKELLGAHGEVKWSKVMRATAGQSRISATCAALFEMESEEQAAAAIEALNNKVLSFEVVAPAMKVRYAENKAAKAAADKPSEATEPQIPEMPATRLVAAAPPPPP